MSDASAVVEYLLRTRRSDRIRETMQDAEVSLYTVALCGVEVASALRRAVLAGRLTEERAREALVDYADLPILRHGHEPLLARMLELRDHFSAYDAAYAVLAEALGAALLTADDRLRRAAEEHLGLPTLPA